MILFFYLIPRQIFEPIKVDYNEELNAIYGGTMEFQAQFLANSIKAIKSLYVDQSRPVIIVGHSMGGLVARYALSNGLIDANDVEFYITLGTPHKFSIISEPKLEKFTKKALSDPTNTPCVSVSGGIRDIQVRPGVSQVVLVWTEKILLFFSLIIASMFVPKVYTVHGSHMITSPSSGTMDSSWLLLGRYMMLPSIEIG